MKRPLSARGWFIGGCVYALAAGLLFVGDRWPILAWVLAVGSVVAFVASWDRSRETRG